MPIHNSVNRSPRHLRFVWIVAPLRKGVYQLSLPWDVRDRYRARRCSKKIQENPPPKKNNSKIQASRNPEIQKSKKIHDMNRIYNNRCACAHDGQFVCVFHFKVFPFDSRLRKGMKNRIDEYRMMTVAKNVQGYAYWQKNI